MSVYYGTTQLVLVFAYVFEAQKCLYSIIHACNCRQINPIEFVKQPLVICNSNGTSRPNIAPAVDLNIILWLIFHNGGDVVRFFYYFFSQKLNEGNFASY